MIRTYSRILYYITLVASLTLLSIMSIDISKHYNKKLHGIHKTNFTFTGNYLVKPHKVHQGKMYYIDACQSITDFGECYYDFYKTTMNQYAEDYAANYCDFNTTLNGYISTENYKCFVSNPNTRIFNLLLAYRIIWCYIVLNVLHVIIMCFKPERQIVDTINERNKIVNEITVI